MSKLFYVCKYTPCELLQALGAQCENLNVTYGEVSAADLLMGPNVCGFGKTIVEAVVGGAVRELVLVNCCDTMQTVYDVLHDSGKLDFLHLVDVLHTTELCSVKHLVGELNRLADAYGAYRKTSLTKDALRKALCAAPQEQQSEPHVVILGARMSDELFMQIQKVCPVPVKNATCVNNRSVGAVAPSAQLSFDELLMWYARELLGQPPCMRMRDTATRRMLYSDPNVQGIIYHTVKFCDFYSFEYAELKAHATVPLVKIESDYTNQSSRQLATRIGAFAEKLTSSRTPLASDKDKNPEERQRYFAGIDSGSTTTNAIIIDQAGTILAGVVVPTGARASTSANTALENALASAQLSREDVEVLVATGCGRTVVQGSTKTITEITCHARGAYELNPAVRCVIDIGGQDSKVITLDENGAVKSFVMNDKCAAGTGRFLDTMARVLEMDLNAISKRGLTYSEDITISSTCTVFAESEVVSLIAQDKDIDDIVHGLNKAVALKTCALARRIDAHGPYLMTGGVSKNHGLVKELERQLGSKIFIDDQAQLCGALGAALLACEG